MTALPEFDTTEKAATGGLPDFEVALPEFGEDVITAPKSPEQLAVQNFMGRKETGFPSPGDVTSFGARLSQASNLPIKAGGAVVADILNRGRMESALEGTAPAETKQAVITPESMRMETPEEKSQRTEFRGDKPLIPVQGTSIDPEGTDAQRLLSQWSTPEQALMFPAAMTPVGRALMLAQMPGQIIQQVKETVAGQGTDEEKRDRINNLFAMGMMIAHGKASQAPIVEPPPQPEWAKPIGPVATGEALVMSPGATAPRSEVTDPTVTESQREVLDHESLRTESTESIVGRTKVGDQRDAAFSQRAESSREVEASLKPGDVIIDENGDRRVVADVTGIKRGKPVLWVYAEGTPVGPSRTGGEWHLDSTDKIERRSAPAAAPTATEIKPPEPAAEPTSTPALAPGSEEPVPKPAPTIPETAPVEAKAEGPTLKPAPSETETDPAKIAASIGGMKFDAVQDFKFPGITPKWQFSLVDPETGTGTTFYTEAGASREQVARKAGIKTIQMADGLEGNEGLKEAERRYDERQAKTAKPEAPKPAAPAPEAKPPAAATVTPAAAAEGGNPFDTSATSQRLTDLQKTKPRPLNKKYGPNPTPEQAASSAAETKAWNREYRKAQKEHKETVAKSNAWIESHKEPSATALAALAAQQQPQLPGTAPTLATMLGPGASGAAGEINPTGPRGTPEPPTYGPAARVLEARRQRGVIAPVEPGVGTTPEAEIQRGRQLLSQGADPEKIMAETERTKRFNSDDAAVLRAHGERLEQAAYAAADQHGVNSPEYEKAWEADSAWSKRMKSVATEWHRVGQGLQGETEIDTGTFHGLRKAFLDATGKDFTEKQAADATRIAKDVKDAADAADKAKDDVVANLDKETAKAPEKPTTGKQGEAVPDAKTLWRRAKAMLDSGETDFDNIRQKLAIEFGIPMKEVSRLLAEPKGSRKLTDDMYRKMSDRRRLVSQAKNWIKNQQIPGWLKFIRAVPRAFFIDKIIGHGTVGMITHAGLNVFNPGAWKTYWPEFFRQYKLLAKPAYHERIMQDLVRDPNFVKARRAGLANDPFRYTDDYNSAFSQYFKRLGLGGSRGFDSLKLFRQARFNQLWDRLPDASRTPDMAQVIADGVNHATGTVRMPFREWANWTFFAPKLEGSRWAWMVGDPLKSAKTFADWKNSTPEARAQAMGQLKEKAAVTGTYLGLLALNQGILQSMGSNQKINYTNPRRGDFLAFKVAGYNLGVVSPMLGMVRLFANLIHAAAGTRGQVEKLDTRAAQFGKLGEQYLRGKLSPFAGFGVDVISQADFQGRPMPYSSDRTPAYLRREGLGPYTYGEYAAQQFTPIPVSEAIREVWRDQGINENQINTWLHALTVAGIMGATGARLSTPTPEAPAPQEKFPSFQSLLK